MSTHSPGSLYQDWRNAERGVRALMKDIEASQITHPISEYTEERVAKLVEQMHDAKRFTFAGELKFNV